VRDDMSLVEEQPDANSCAEMRAVLLANISVSAVSCRGGSTTIALVSSQQ
jgi:hypothetical protein